MHAQVHTHTRTKKLIIKSECRNFLISDNNITVKLTFTTGRGARGRKAQKFKASLSYVTSWKSTWATEDPVLKIQTKPVNRGW